MYIHKDILVGGGVDYIWSKKNRAPVENTDNIVIHYSAGATALSSVRYLADHNTPVSAHLLIARNAKIYQMVDFQTQAWHAGKSQLFGMKNLNQYSIGIELDNYGLLKLENGNYITWFGKRVPPEEVISLPHPVSGLDVYWHRFEQNQLEALKEVCRLLIFHYKVKRIVGHNEISLSGKIDPGPAFPLADFKKLIHSH